MRGPGGEDARGHLEAYIQEDTVVRVDGGLILSQEGEETTVLGRW